MPIDFSSTQSIRLGMINRNLRNPTQGPQLFTPSNYQVSNLTNSPVLDLPNAEDSRTAGLVNPRTLNTFKPQTYTILEGLNVQQRRANLQLYPYFNTGIRHTYIGYYTNTNYDNESELIKFAARNMKDSDTSPILNRIKQNLNANINGRNKIGEALGGNIQTAVDIVTGKLPLVVPNYKITVAKTLPGKGIDFVQTVLGVTTPFSEIPGDYLSNPRNPINVRPQAQTGIGNLIQDVTGSIGSLVGIRRRPRRDRKPSDLFIEYMGEGQKQTLYNLLSYSKYAPNYTTSARSQQSSKLFQFTDNFAGSVKNILGLEAPRGVAYIGDDRGEDVQFAMHDFNGRPVRSNYYLTLMFDPIAAQLFHNEKSYNNGGPIGGVLTWIGKNSQNKLGVNNREYGSESSELENSLSRKYGFREDSILAETQRILDSKPKDGSGRSHIGHIIDQTSRSFSEGDTIISKGSAIKYVDKFTKQENGIEYARVWTKDRPYLNYSDSMKKTGIIRKYDDSVMGGSGRAWNLNIAPMSNGRKDNRSFDGSSNIFGGYKYGMDADGKSFYAKKYMFSIENLAWKTSKKDGFTVLDLPFCERGPNGGRVMWFPPYDLKISENNSARWETNTFLGRPEPIYTYQNTERSGQLSFKVVVDHPSILNLMVREEFKNMSDEEADNYINAFFAGAKDVDFYDMIRKYTTLSPSDVELITRYLEKGQNPQEIIPLKYANVSSGNNANNINSSDTSRIKIDANLTFGKDMVVANTPITTNLTYEQIYNNLNAPTYLQKVNDNITQATLQILNKTLAQRTDQEKKELKFLFGTDDPSGSSTTNTNKIITEIQTIFSNLTSEYNEFVNGLATLKTNLKEKKISNLTIYVLSSTYADNVDANPNLIFDSTRESYSVVKQILINLKNDGVADPQVKGWVGNDNGSSLDIDHKYSLKRDLGYEIDGVLEIKSKNIGDKYVLTNGKDCQQERFETLAYRQFSPVSFGCRQTTVRMIAQVLPPPRDLTKDPTEIPRYKLEIDGNEPITYGKKLRKPNIDVMKRIIMKTLSESYYFKMLSEDSPMAFKSLREKLKYFHPAFHSTTPEGLNSRLTFLQQCIRPGDTLPVKGISDDNDINARNTSFGPPPICVLRVGDFYHSKIIIRDVNISFDENVWDLNPEGIGVQPMIATVQLQINFLGGQGLREPVSKLQNALSSNFYANTEMYDERSISTSEKIGGMDREEFTKKFLEEIRNNKLDDALPNSDQNTNKITEGKYIGEFRSGNPSSINYFELVSSVVENCNEYFNSYIDFYNTFNPFYGEKIMSIYLSSKYRTINKFTVDEDSSTSQDIEILGEYGIGKEMEILLRGFKAAMDAQIDSTDFIDVFNIKRFVKNSIEETTNNLLKTRIKEILIIGYNGKESIIDQITENVEIKKLESNRNKLIDNFDKLNYLVKYQEDGLITGTTNYKFAQLQPTFTSNQIYKNYKHVVEYIKIKHSKLSEDIDDSINFNSSVISNNDFISVIKVLLRLNVNDIINVIELEFEQDKLSKIKDKITDFMKEPKRKNFKIGKNPDSLKTNQELVDSLNFNILTTGDITLQDKIDKLKKINSSVNNLETKLNFYRNGS